MNVASEAEDQVRRLRNHPSIVIWCGNNETEVALAWKDRDKLPADVRFQMWQDYVTTFSGILAAAVNRLHPETPYWPSSPSADYEETFRQVPVGRHARLDRSGTAAFPSPTTRSTSRAS